MKTLIRLYLLASLLIFASANAQAQDPFYSQFLANRLSFNPALAGSQGTANLITQYRAQSARTPGYYTKLGIAYDQPLAQGWAVGINTQYDFAGVGYTASNHHLHIARELQIGAKQFIRAGLSGGFNLRTLNYDKLISPNQVDPQTGMITPTPTSGYEHFTLADFNAGLVYYNKSFFLSATAKHIQGNTFSEVSKFYLPTSFAAMTGIRIPVELGSMGSLALTPTAHYQRHGQFNNFFMMGLALEMKKIQLITWFQPKSSCSIGIGTTLGPFQLAYQIDRYRTNITVITPPSHEFSLSYRFGGKEKRQRSAVPMPLF
ncbi:MAG: PorP/SprF family type IX secretion system membrane protein [Bacteroidia bacterium]